MQALAHSDPTVFMSWSCGITVAWLVTDTLVVAGAMQTLPTPARAAATLVWTRMARVMLGARPLTAKGLTLRGGARRHKVWQYNVGSKMAASALVDGGVAYIGTDGKTLHAVDAGTGILKWTWDAPDKIQTTPVVVGGAVVFGCNDNFVYAIEIK